MYPYLGHFIFPIYSYGVLLSLAFLGAILLALYNGRFMGIQSNTILDLAIWFIIGAMAGARILYIILYPQQFSSIFSYFAFNKGGLVFFGGFIMTTLVVIGFAHYHSLMLRSLGDLIAPSLAFGHFLGRIGCFLNGCCFGKTTDSILGLSFPLLSNSIPRHPAQLYEAAFLACLLLSANFLFKRVSRHEWGFPGAVWGVYLLAYSPFRFLIEFLRDDDRGGFFTPFHFSISQCISILTFAFGIFWIVGCQRLYQKETKEQKNEQTP